LVTKVLSQDVMLLAFVPLSARSRVSGQQMFSARKRSANVAAAEGFVCAKAQRQQQRVLSVRKRSGSNSTMLVTKALSQDVMLLAFVPLSLIPKESPSRNEDQPFCIRYMYWMSLSFVLIKTKLQQRGLSVRKRSDSNN